MIFLYIITYLLSSSSVTFTIIKNHKKYIRDVITTIIAILLGVYAYIYIYTVRLIIVRGKFSRARSISCARECEISFCKVAFFFLLLLFSLEKSVDCRAHRWLSVRAILRSRWNVLWGRNTDCLYKRGIARRFNVYHDWPRCIYITWE